MNSRTGTVVQRKVTIPEWIGGYRIIREIGRGATAVVYLACSGTGKQVAIKWLPPWHSDDTIRAMFRTEAILSGRLNHPNIVSVISSNVNNDDNECYLALEYVEGGSLDDYSKPDSLMPLPALLKIARQTTEALSYAFRKGIVHRDIKPGNILVSTDGVARLTDFGCALIANEDITRIGVAGSLSYMSPEHVNGNEVDHRSDIYSFGAVLYRILCGQNAFSASGHAEMVAAILDGRKTPLSMRRPNLPQKIFQIIEKCMAVNPDDRYQTHDKLLIDLYELENMGGAWSNIDEDAIFNAMGSCAFFKDFSPRHIWEMLRCGSLRNFEQKDVLMTDGEHSMSFFIILEGKVAITKNNRLLNVICQGDCVGEAALFGENQLRSATVTAIEKVVAIEVLKTRVEALSGETIAKIDRGVLVSLAGKLHITNTRLLGLIG